MRLLAAAVVFSLGAAAPAAASAECRDSASGAMSVDISLSPRSGRQCLHDVVVHRGAGCGGGIEWSATLGCDETRRMVISDGGVLVNLRAPRPNRRGWEIIRIFAHEASVVVVRSIRYDRIPGVPPAPARPRLRLSVEGLRVGEDPGAPLVPLTRLVGLGRRSGRR